MGSAAGGRYSYTAGNARLCGSLGIEGPTYQIGFDAVRELLGPIKGKIFLDFGCGAGRSARLPESPRCQARLRRRSRSGHDRRGRIPRAWRGDLLSFRRRHPGAGRICRRRCQPERLRGDTHTVKTSLVGSGHRLARCPCRAARYGNPGTPHVLPRPGGWRRRSGTGLHACHPPGLDNRTRQAPPRVEPPPL